MSDIPQMLRAQVSARAKECCEYCLLPSEGQVAWFNVDHIIPQSRGGETELSNLALACPRCNGHKWAHEHARNPESGEIVYLFNPRTQDWNSHFRITTDLEIRGTSACGRATVALLRMNEPQMLLIRRLVAGLGIGFSRGKS